MSCYLPNAVSEVGFSVHDPKNVCYRFSFADEQRTGSSIACSRDHKTVPS